MIYYLTILFGILAIFCSFCVISVRNPIHAILSLILVFCNITFILIIWNAEFLAIIFLIVYVGAIAVLFLFVVMMLNIKIIELNETFWRYIPIGLIISAIVLLEVYIIIFQNSSIIFNLLNYDTTNYFFFEHGIKFDVKNEDMHDWIESWGLTDIQFINLLSESDNQLKPLAIVKSETSVNFFNWYFTNEVKTHTETLGWAVYTYMFYNFFIIGLILLLAMIGSIVLILNQNINVKRQKIYKQTFQKISTSLKLKY